MDCGSANSAAIRMCCGRHVRVDTDPYTIVGVMPPDFRHPGQTLEGDVEMWAACGLHERSFSASAGARI